MKFVNIKAENSGVCWALPFPSALPLFMEFSGQEYWSGLPFPSPRNLPDQGIKPRSPALQADSLLSEPLTWLFYEKYVTDYLFPRKTPLHTPNIFSVIKS